MKKLVALTMATAMTLSLAACGGASSSSAAASTATTDTASSAAESTASEAEDTITVMVPPVTGDYLDKMTEWADEFHEMYPNLTMEVIRHLLGRPHHQAVHHGPGRRGARTSPRSPTQAIGNLRRKLAPALET